MTQSVNGVNNAGSNKQVKVSRQSELTVRTGESLSVFAQKFGMSQKEFMEWTGLKSANLKAGQKKNCVFFFKCKVNIKMAFDGFLNNSYFIFLFLIKSLIFCVHEQHARFFKDFLSHVIM